MDALGGRPENRGVKRLPPETEMYRALLARDASYEGIFFLGVSTTGVFCRPTCPARRPRPENVEYFATAAEAERAGFRPCKRCRPREARGARPAWVERVLDRLEREGARRLTDAELAAMDVSPSRMRRYFRENFGMTFQAWQRARALGLAHDGLREGVGPGAAAHDSGYESESGFREAFRQLFGAPPGRARDSECLRGRILSSPIGPLVACSSPRGIALLEFVDRRGMPGQTRALSRWFDAPVVPGTSELLDRLEAELAAWFAGELRELSVPIDAPGTPFQVAVWTALRRIPYGQTRSYDQIATEVGRPDARRAVGRANGQNRVAIAIPCHRVVRKDGALSGYGGGVWRKRWLLELEGGAEGSGVLPFLSASDESERPGSA